MVCEKCGKDIGENSKVCENCAKDSLTENSKKKGLSSKVVIVVSIVVGILIGVFWGLTDTDSDSDKSVIDHKNESGAIISMSLDQFSEDFEEAYTTVEKSAKFDDVEINLKDSWEKTSSDVDESGVAYDYYSAYINGIELRAKVYDEQISLIMVDFTPFKTQDEIEFATILSTASIIACSDMNVEDANRIFGYVAGSEGFAGYKNDFLFYNSDHGYFIIRAVSTSFVQSYKAKGISVINL